MSPPCFKVKEHVLPCQYIREYPGATLHDQEDLLKLHIKQYTPLDESAHQSGALTIIGAHANGFPKELYEPFWDDLCEALRQRGQAVRSIWIADVAQQGMSGVLNEDKLGNDPSWTDHPRDLLHMINHFRQEMPRPLVGIGHSMGGNHLVNLSLIHPRLLSTLILIDPVIRRASSSAPFEVSFPNFASVSTFRRDIWPSRAEAVASFKKSKFYQSWDPRVLEQWIKYGLRDRPTAIYPRDSKSDSEKDTKSVTLATTKHQEVFTFLRPNFEGKDSKGHEIVNRSTHADLDLTAHEIYPFYRPEQTKMFDNLPHLRPSTLYIFGGKSPLSPVEQRRQKMESTGVGVGGSGGAKDGRVEEVVFEEGGHLMPMEIVGATADASAVWIAKEMERWVKQEEQWTSEWEAKSRKGKTMIPEEWERRMGGDPRRKRSEKL